MKIRDKCEGASRLDNVPISYFSSASKYIGDMQVCEIGLNFKKKMQGFISKLEEGLRSDSFTKASL